MQDQAVNTPASDTPQSMGETVAPDVSAASKAYDSHDLSVDAPVNMDLKDNDFEAPESPTFNLTVEMNELRMLGNALAGMIAGSWIFNPDDTIDDDIRTSYQNLQLLKKLNAALPGPQRLGCIWEDLLPFGGGDVYIDACYRLKTREMGNVITVAQFDFVKHTVCFKLFDPVRYPNAKTLQSCLGDTVPLDSILSIEEVSELTKEEKEGFAVAIREAWVTWY